jgi:dephospho-CoA kinase
MFMAALTGNFGMGKSSVLSLFRDLGAVTLDTDLLVARLLEEKEVIREVRKLLGEEAVKPDGTIDKRAVARKVFGDEASRRKLEGFLHPLVFREIDSFIEQVEDGNSIVIIEVPLLFEGEHQGRFAKVITVHTPEETAVGRLVRSGFSREEALARLNAQIPIEVKKRRADYTIDNGRTKEETKRQVEEVYRLLIKDMKRQNEKTGLPQRTQRSQREDKSLE